MNIKDPSPLNDHTILEQLNRILSSRYFVGAEMQCHFLRYVVETTLAGSSDQIKQYTIAVRAFGRATDFSPKVDPIVRVQAGRLRRNLARYYLEVGRHDPIIITLPVGRYVPAFHPNTAVPAPSVEVPPIETPPLPTGPSLAVLHFVAHESDDTNRYLATGLTEQMIRTLSSYPNLLVIGPLSRDRLEQQGLGIRGIGESYGVRFVLQGTVRPLERAIRVTASVTDTNTHAHLWGKTFTQSFDTDVPFEVKEEITTQIAAAVADSFGIIPRTLFRERRTEGQERIESYDALLRYYHSMMVVTEEAMHAAERALSQALEQQPAQPLILAALANTWTSTYRLGIRESTAIFEDAERLIRRAIALDPSCGLAHHAMSVLHFLRRQPALGVQSMNRALALNPHQALQLGRSALNLTMSGQGEQGLELMQQAMRLNPHYPSWYHFIPFMVHYSQGKYEAALTDATRINTPGVMWAHLCRAAAWGQLAHHAEAKAELQAMLALRPDFPQRTRPLMQRMVFADHLIDALLEGLHKAGLPVTASSEQWSSAGYR